MRSLALQSHHAILALLSHQLIYVASDITSETVAMQNAEHIRLFTLEHDLPTEGHEGFSERAKVAIDLLSDAKFSVNSVSPNLSPHQLQLLQDRLLSNDLYTIRARSDPLDAYSTFVYTSVPVCMLANAKFQEDLAFHMTDNGKLFALEYRMPYVRPSMCDKLSVTTVYFKSYGHTIRSRPGPAFPAVLASYVQAPGGELVQKQDKEIPPEQQQSFLRRYWYIVLPIVIFSLFGSEPAPRNSGGDTTNAASSVPNRRQ